MTTAHERATKLVNAWAKDAQGLPLGISINRLSLAIAEALDAAEQKAYERGLRAAVEFNDRDGGEPGIEVH